MPSVVWRWRSICIYPPLDISERMMQLEPVAMRLDVRRGKNDSLIINDTYNSDINSIKIALDFQQQRRMDRPFKKDNHPV